MREIKFRAYYAPEPAYGGEEVIKPRMIYFDEIGYCDEYNHLSFRLADDSRDKNGGEYSNLCASIDDFKHIMQFTGLLDKSGREIYEGDIVIWSREDLADAGEKIVSTKGQGIIEWQECFAMFGFKQQNKMGCLQLPDNILEIIGNIYENPELLNPA